MDGKCLAPDMELARPPANELFQRSTPLVKRLLPEQLGSSFELDEIPLERGDGVILAPDMVGQGAWVSFQRASPQHSHQ
jgi:hypothetical protein